MECQKQERESEEIFSEMDMGSGSYKEVGLRSGPIRYWFYCG